MLGLTEFSFIPFIVISENDWDNWGTFLWTEMLLDVPLESLMPLLFGWSECSNTFESELFRGKRKRQFEWILKVGRKVSPTSVSWHGSHYWVLPSFLIMKRDFQRLCFVLKSSVYKGKCRSFPSWKRLKSNVFSSINLPVIGFSLMSSLFFLVSSLA